MRKQGNGIRVNTMNFKIKQPGSQGHYTTSNNVWEYLHFENQPGSYVMREKVMK